LTDWNILYVYPQWHTVSFSLIARKHIEYMNRLNRVPVYEMDELQIDSFLPVARGIPVVTSNWGSWTDYVPPFLRVKTGRRVQPLPGNVIHTGYGYAVDVDDAVNKVLDILDNYEEYKAKTEEWRMKVLANEYRWDLIAVKLLDVVGE